MARVGKEELLSAVEAMVKELLDKKHKRLDEKLSVLGTKQNVGNLIVPFNSLVKNNQAMKNYIKWLKEVNGSFKDRLDSYEDRDGETI